MAVKGMAALKERLNALRAACESAAEAAVRTGVDRAAAIAREEAPVRTGRLRSSIRGESGGLSGAVQADASYAAAVELGGNGSPARPFMLPAAQAAQTDFLNEACRNLKGANR